MVYYDIENTLNKIDNKKRYTKEKYHNYSEIYPFTNENIKGYYNKEEIKGKDILTVCSSGDHLFNAILMDANSVDCFDINRLSKYYMYLKKAAIECLEYDEFIKLFVKNLKIFDNKSTNKNVYTKIRDILSEDIRIFWDNIFNNIDVKKLKSSKLFSDDQSTKKNIITCNNYLNEENFYKLKEKIPKYNPNFYNLNIKDLPIGLERKYDVIYLSNIAKYIDGIFNGPGLIGYRKFILEELSKNLKKEGLIFLAYIYDYLCYSSGVVWYHKIDNYKDRKEAFDSNEFETRTFDSAYGSFLYDSNDAVILYKKELDSVKR